MNLRQIKLVQDQGQRKLSEIVEIQYLHQVDQQLIMQVQSLLHELQVVQLIIQQDQFI